MRRLACLLPLLCVSGQAAGQALSVQAVPGQPLLVVSGVRLADFEGRARDAALQALARQLYARYRDDADFLLLVANRRSIPAQTSVEGYHFRVSNGVSGIGAPLFNDGARFGGTRRLQGILYFPRRTAFWRLPLLHELAHQWMNDALPTAERGHFGFCGAGSQVGGFDPGSLKSLGNDVYQAKNLAGRPFGTAANGSNSVPYSTFELYLMGLAPASEVAPFPCAEKALWLDEKRGLFRAAKMNTLTVADLTRRLGPRLPDYTGSPKTFRVLAVLLSETPPSPADVRATAAAMRQVVAVGDNGDSTFSFWEATHGRGRLELVTPTRK